MRAIEQSIVQHENKKLRLGIPVVIAITVVLAIAAKLPWPLAVVLSTQIVLFLYLFDRPVWAMAALIVGQFTASGYLLTIAGGAELSIRFLWTVLAIMLVVPLLKSRQGISKSKEK